MLLIMKGWQGCSPANPLRKVRPGFRAKHNYASRPGRKGGGGFKLCENRRAGVAQNRYAVYA